MARSLRFWLALGLSSLVGLVVLTVIAAVLGILLPRLNAEVEAKNRALGEAAALQVEDFLAKSVSELERLAADVAASPPGAPAAMRVMLDTLANVDVQLEAIYVVDDGDRVVEVGLPGERRRLRDDLVGIDFSGRPFVRAARQERRHVWSDTYLSPRGRIVVALAVPLQLPGRGDAALGALVAELDLHELSRFARAIGSAGEVLSVIVDRRRQIVGHPDPARSLRQESLAQLPLLQGEAASATRTALLRLDGIDYIGSTTGVRGPGWTALVAQPTAKAFATVRATLLALAAASLLALSIAFVAAFIASRRMSYRVAEFGRHLQAIAAGDYHAPIPRSGTDEIESLAQSMKRMAEAVLEREARLQESEAKYRNVIEGTRDLVTRIDREGRLTFVNHMAQRCFGLSAAECIGLSVFDFVHRDDRAATQAVFARWRASGCQNAIQFENRLVARDGAVHRLQWSVVADGPSPLAAAGRPAEGIAFSSIARDVTAERAAEAERLAAEELLARQAARAVAMLELPAAAERLDEAAFMQYGLEAAERLTGSRMAFVHSVDEERQSVELVAWSPGMRGDDRRSDSARRCPLAEAGVWADAVRRRAPLVVDDCAPTLGRRGLPAGIAPPERLLSVPVVDDGRVCLLLGVGNKATPYAEFDVETVQLFGHEIWSIVRHRRAALKMRESEARFRDIANISADWIWEVDTDGRYTFASDGVTRLLGYTPDEVIGKSAFDLMPPYEVARVAQAFAEIVATGADFRDLENVVLGRDGTPHVTLTSGSPMRDADGRLFGYRGVDRDITRQRRAEEAQRLAATVFSASAEGILITDAAQTILSVNPALVAITGYAAEEVLGKTPAMFNSGRHDSEFYREMWAGLERDGRWRGEIWNRRKNGTVFPEWLTITAVRDGGGAVTHYIGSFFDISERKDAEQHIEFLAHHDALTKLPNRMLLDDRIRQAIAKAKRSEEHVAVMFLDLDRFKLINDTLGHDLGDRLLERIADVLCGLLRETETVARLGGDEFIIVIPELQEIDRVAMVARKVIESVAMPQTIEGRELHVTPSIGISIFPADGADPATLLRNADTAMYHAKERGRNNFQFFAQAMNQVVQERVTIENDLRRALERREFLLHYQPQVDCRSGQILGMEALIRWQHPQRGLIGPDRFISVAEETGLIVPIGEWVLDEACRQARRWHDAGQAGLRIGVNLSARQFQQPDLSARIAAAIGASGIDPSTLELELTESMLMADPDAATEVLRQLAALGVKMAIDDFGTGYSSLAYLKRFPVTRLKIDRSFVSDLSTDANDAAIVSAVVAMAASLKLEVIAEGVETLGQLTYLAAHGCHDIQGFYFSRPQAAADFTSFRFAPAPDGA